MPHVLPSDWQDVIARVRGLLDESAAANDHREREFLVRFPVDAPGLADLELGAAEVPPLPGEVDEADAVAAETALREFAKRSETLRMKLSEVAR